ncbi:Pentatricopeptide repeat-containing protein [Rhynchospora pubera]|uniref:Pentatricopeptide repeat-containing protein n=1 Tax=Rhynchospora pubera TaxID=906938 RepID=A0AAV8EUR4_9POAL|nr:Pentatricopeptide repeat-containing protein [Rhynchospora pubera]
MNSLSSCPLCNFYPNFRPKPSIRRDVRPPICTGEEANLKWTNLKRNLTPEERIAISRLPKTMADRCKALMKKLICFSSPDENLHLLLAAWVKTLKPSRADWLAVLKEMKRIEHPLYIEVYEYALLEDTFEANVRDFTKLIHTFGKQNDLHRAEGTLDNMKRRGFPLDLVTLTTLIDMYSKAGDLKHAKEIFDEIKLLGIDYDKRAFGSMVMAYIRADMLEEAESLIKESEAREIYTGTEVYKALLRAYSNKGDSKGAQRVFDSIQFARVVPDSRICALLVNAYCLAGQTTEARCVIENMRKAGLRPCERCITLVIDAYEKDNRLDKALDFLAEMETDGIAISEDTLGVLQGWFDKIGVKEEMDEILKEVSLLKG